MKGNNTKFFVGEEKSIEKQTRFDTKVVISEKICRDLYSGINYQMKGLSRAVLEEVNDYLNTK